jgi:serine acetyltransferase
VILSGVTVGESALVSAGALVVREVSARSGVAGPGATHLLSPDDEVVRERERTAEFEAFDRASKHPWRLEWERHDPVRS